MTKNEAWEMIDSAIDHSYSEKDVMKIKEALALPAQEPVAYPEGNVVAHCICGSWPGGKCRKCPKQPAQEIDAVYGYCPTCGAKGVSRERHPDGSDICASGHTYKSKDALATPQQPAQQPVTHTINSTHTAAVATDHYWIPIDANTPRGVKLQLLGQGGVAQYSNYHGDAFWSHWAPLPKRRD